MAKRDSDSNAIVYTGDRGTRRGLAERAGGSSMLALFAGTTGTGKTLAAEVLASDFGRPFHKVDLGTIVSKYIGESCSAGGRT